MKLPPCWDKAQWPEMFVNPFPAKLFTLLMLFSSKSSIKEILKRLEIMIFRTPLRFRMYQKLEFTQFIIQHHPAEYKLHTLCFATDLIWRPHGKERVKRKKKQFECTYLAGRRTLFQVPLKKQQPLYSFVLLCFKNMSYSSEWITCRFLRVTVAIIIWNHLIFQRAHKTELFVCKTKSGLLCSYYGMQRDNTFARINHRTRKGMWQNFARTVNL